MTYARRCDWNFPTARLIEFLEKDAAGLLPDGAPLLAPAVADCVPVSRRARFAAARRGGAILAARVLALAPSLHRCIAVRRASIRGGFGLATFPLISIRTRPCTCCAAS